MKVGRRSLLTPPPHDEDFRSRHDPDQITRALPRPDMRDLAVRRSWLEAPIRCTNRKGASEGPSLQELMVAAAFARTEFDAGKREAGIAAISRTGAGYTGPGGGFGLKLEQADTVWDKARSVDGPLRRCIFGTTLQRNFSLVGFGESSRADRLRWGGIQGTWGLSETKMPLSTQPSASSIEFDMKRLLIYTAPISRNLLADTELALPLLSYASHAEIRYQIEYAMINSSLSGPRGVVNLDGTPGVGVVQIAKEGSQSAGTILETNITKMWAALYGPCKRNAAWFCNDDTFGVIDETATTLGWPSVNYFPAGMFGNEYAFLKGRPIIPCEACPTAGTPGDLVLADFSQWWFIVNKPKPGASTLAFDVTVPSDIGHQGIVALPEDVVESRATDQQFFDTDSVGFCWKLRGDGRPIWTTTLTNRNSATVGWAVILAARAA